MRTYAQKNWFLGIHPALMGSKTPTSKFANARELGGRSTAHKSPIGSTLSYLVF